MKVGDSIWFLLTVKGVYPGIILNKYIFGLYRIEYTYQGKQYKHITHKSSLEPRSDQ